MKLARLIPLAALALAACQQAKDSAPAASPDAKPGLSVSGGRLVLPAVSGNPGAAYFTLANNGEKPTTLAAISIDGAGKAETHETMGGSMEPVQAIELKPGGSVKFETGGKHVMAFDLAPKIAAGGSAEMTLTFADGDKISAPLKVEAAGGGMVGTDHGADMEHGDMH